MMRLKIFTLFGLILLAGLNMAIAQDNLTIVLKNGSELTGYISRQRPGENFEFSTTKAFITVPDSSVRSIVDTDIKIASLSPEWVKWAHDNNAFRGTGDDRFLTLSNVVTKNGTVNQVRVLERGVRLRYLELEPNIYNLPWDTVEIVRAEKRPSLLLSGVNRRYKMASGVEFDGMYVEEVPGRTMGLLGNNGIVEVFDTRNIVKENRYKINPAQSLIEQSDLLDAIQLKDGSVIKGVIYERNFAKNAGKSKNYLLIHLLENDETESFDLDDIVEYRKEINTKYSPVTDIRLADGTAAINRNIVNLMPTDEYDGIVTVMTDSLKLSLEPDSPLKIFAEFEMENAKAQHLKLIKVNEYEKKDGRQKKVYYGFSYEDMVKNAVIPLSVTTSINGVSKVEFELSADDMGTYGVYNPLTRQIAIFVIAVG